MAVTSNLSFLGKIGTIDRGLGIYNFSAQFPPCIYYSSMIVKLSSQGKAMRIRNGGFEDVENSLVQSTDLRSEFYQAGIT